MYIKGGFMEEDDAYIEHIESEEIKKLVEKIYSAKPENVNANNPQQHDYDSIIAKIDEINLENPRKKAELYK